ncbi:antibiotic biosynthesis monooxygenase [Mycetocola tolaasinivorans]|uniref:Antibiotic biosynthesis monooxygenase n=1 Tax=Mycetocola tolaasinivorans TaxID=76635 RepID=A0A3L7A2H8_9MICO|nr:antibiotic biosynthesis monooxygenase [Mycetocola tolaasinivorans]RLP74264.1 antibiotic biosynthesis monooxygenase [Mycetocola tolaasinivorans]
MILEHAVLPVVPGREAEFEVAFDRARTLIAQISGFRGLELRRSLETPEHYLLLVRWETVEDHTEGFRGSPQYQGWRELLHEFYSPFPVVEHFVAVAEVSDPGPRG